MAEEIIIPQTATADPTEPTLHVTAPDQNSINFTVSIHGWTPMQLWALIGWLEHQADAAYIAGQIDNARKTMADQQMIENVTRDIRQRGKAH